MGQDLLGMKLRMPKYLAESRFRLPDNALGVAKRQIDNCSTMYIPIHQYRSQVRCKVSYTSMYESKN